MLSAGSVVSEMSEGRALRGRSRWPLVGILLIVSACATVQERADKANQLAVAGVAFTDTLPPLYDEYFRLGVEVDTIVLEQLRNPNAGSGELREELTASDNDFRQTAHHLRGLKAHAALLRNYFLALQAMAASDAPEGISAANKGIVDDLGMVRADLAEARIAGVPVADAVEPVSGFIVGAVQNRAIEAELEARGATILREIELHERLLEAIASSMVADLEAKLDHEVGERLKEEFADTSQSLPEDWAERRAAYLQQTVEVQAVNAAATAAQTLRLAWTSYAAGGLDQAPIDSIIADLDAVATFLAKAKAAREGGG